MGQMQYREVIKGQIPTFWRWGSTDVNDIARKAWKIGNTPVRDLFGSVEEEATGPSVGLDSVIRNNNRKIAQYREHIRYFIPDIITN